MNDPFSQIPEEMRDFAQRSIDQARKAFEGYMASTTKVIGLVEDASSTANGNLRAFTERIIFYSEKNIEQALVYAQRLVKAKDMAEMARLQTEFVASQMTLLQNYVKENEYAASNKKPPHFEP